MFGRVGDLAGRKCAFVVTLLIFVLVLFVTMVYGPIAAFLVESFPAKFRYTSADRFISTRNTCRTCAFGVLSHPKHSA